MVDNVSGVRSGRRHGRSRNPINARLGRGFPTELSRMIGHQPRLGALVTNTCRAKYRIGRNPAAAASPSLKAAYQLRSSFRGLVDVFSGATSFPTYQRYTPPIVATLLRPDRRRLFLRRDMGMWTSTLPEGSTCQSKLTISCPESREPGVAAISRLPEDHTNTRSCPVRVRESDRKPTVAKSFSPNDSGRKIDLRLPQCPAESAGGIWGGGIWR